MRHLSLLLLCACSAAKTVPIDGTTDSGTTDSGTTDDTGQPDTADTADTADTGTAEPTADTSVWDGTETFTIDTWGDNYDCDGDQVGVLGAELVDASLSAACPACDHFYELTRDSDTACDWVDLDTELVRGLDLGDGWAAVYTLTTDNGETTASQLDGAADFDGWTLSYAYVGSQWGVDIDIAGVLVFPPLEP